MNHTSSKECEINHHVRKSAIHISPHEDVHVWLQRGGWTHQATHVYCVMEISLITVKSAGAAKRLQLPRQRNVIIMEEVGDGDGKAIQRCFSFYFYKKCQRKN